MFLIDSPEVPAAKNGPRRNHALKGLAGSAGLSAAPMFCLDFAFTFFFHFSATQLAPPSIKFCDSGDDTAGKQHGLSAPFAFVSGGAAGFASALLLYPVDIVRQQSVPKGVSSFAWSTAPFSAVYLGAYFLAVDRAEDPEPSLGKRAIAAFAATSAAAAVEIPLDQAKLAMTGGSLRATATAAALRVPLGAMLLLAYDHVLSASLSRTSTQMRVDEDP